MIMTKYELPTELMREWRHQIHANPELGFEEEATSALVRDLLTSWGYEVTSGFAITGLVGQRVFGDGTGPKIGIRADMDALPLQEETGLPYQSRNPGKMHACGHDGHTAILLGAAKAISELDVDGFNGTLNLIFQPAEEVGGGGGAQRMMEDGLFDKFPCDLIFALHHSAIIFIEPSFIYLFGCFALQPIEPSSPHKLYLLFDKTLLHNLKYASHLF